MSQMIRLRDLSARRWLAFAAALAFGLPAPAFSGMIDNAVMQIADASSTPPTVPTPEPVAKAAPSPAVTTSAGPAAADANPPALPAQTPPKTDLYAAHTNRILKSEKAGEDGVVHPLQLRYPAYDVTVCTAGCAPGGKVVYKRKKAKQVVERAEMVPSTVQADGQAEQAGSGSLACLAGCYTTPKAYRGVEKRVDLVATPGNWPDEGATEPAGGKAKTPSMGSGDWMKKINSDRDADPPGQ